MLLAIETSCDETSVAVVHGGRVLSTLVGSQVALHEAYGGVVPELATREHLRNLLPLARRAMAGAGIEAVDLDAVAATRGPGLPLALLIGFRAGQALAFGIERTFLGIHHHEAHLYSPWITGDPAEADFEAIEPHVSLIVSGGHTLLVAVEAELKHRVLGSTVDDAAGECFDKTAKLMGLAYPGGPLIDRLASEGRADAYTFPRPMLRKAHDDFSFSGLKTSVRYFLRDHPDLLDRPGKLQDVCASVQAAIVDVLVAKTVRAAKRLGVRSVTASGGVSCNRALRRELGSACRKAGLDLRIAEPAFCTDNAAMVGVLAERKLACGVAGTDLDAEIKPGWALEELGATG